MSGTLEGPGRCYAEVTLPGHHLKTFIRNPKAYFNNRIQLGETYSGNYKLTYTMKLLKLHAQKWFAIHEQAICNFGDLERMFPKHFWGRTEKQKVLADFWNGRYETSFGLIREKYATE